MSSSLAGPVRTCSSNFILTVLGNFGSRPSVAMLSGRMPGLLPGLPLALPAWAQTAPAAQIPFNTVVVTSMRTPARIDETLADTTVIDRAQIEQATGRTLAASLSLQAGVQFWSYGGAGKASPVSMRGLQSCHTLLLINGARDGSATTGAPVWENIPLDSIDSIDSIERIEIVRGPSSHAGLARGRRAAFQRLVRRRRCAS